jgi:hypothetical protein
MALNEKQHRVMADLGELKVIPHSLAGQVEALLRFGDPSDSERARLTELKARCAPAQLPKTSHVASKGTPELFDETEVREKCGDDVHPRVVSAVLEHRVPPAQVKRAVALLGGVDPEDEGAMAMEIARLETLAPDVFPGVHGSPTGAGTGKTSGIDQKAAREWAIANGWARDKTDASAS